MLNSCVLIGRVKQKPVITAGERGYQSASMLVETEMPFAGNDKSGSETFNVRLWRGIADECEAACNEGSVVAIRGRLVSVSEVHEDKTHYNCEVVAEKVSVLS